MVGALTSGMIDAFGVDEPVVQCMMAENPEISYIKDYMETYDFGYAFSKTDKGRKVCDELSEYLKKIKSDGTLNEIEDILFEALVDYGEAVTESSMREEPDTESVNELIATINMVSLENYAAEIL